MVAPIACGVTLHPGSLRHRHHCTAQRPARLHVRTVGPQDHGERQDARPQQVQYLRDAASPRSGSVGILVSNATGVTISRRRRQHRQRYRPLRLVREGRGSEQEALHQYPSLLQGPLGRDRHRLQEGQITGVKVDRVAGTATTTAELPGVSGSGHARRRPTSRTAGSLKAGTVGIWACWGSTSTPMDGVARRRSTLRAARRRCGSRTAAASVCSWTGARTASRTSMVDGVYDGCPDRPVESKDGVVVGPTGVNNLLDGVIVKEHGGNGFVVDGTGTDITNSEVDGIGLDGFVVAGSGSVPQRQCVTEARHGFIVRARHLRARTRVQSLDTNEALSSTATASWSTRPHPHGHNPGRPRIRDQRRLRPPRHEHGRGELADGFIVTNGHGVKPTLGSAATGYTVSRSSQHLNSNAAELNTSFEWVMAPTTLTRAVTRRSRFPQSRSRAPELRLLTD